MRYLGFTSCAGAVSFAWTVAALASLLTDVEGFSPPLVVIRRHTITVPSPLTRFKAFDEADNEEKDVLLYSSEWEEDDDMALPKGDEQTPMKRNKKRWGALSTNTKLKLTNEANDRAIRNRRNKQVESKQDKKRRLMMFVKKAQQEKKRAARVDRKIPFDMRTPLSALTVGAQLTGTVISLTNYGAYIDVGTECDGLLHISQITRDVFVEHPNQVLKPGEQVKVTIRSVNSDKKKLQLTMLPLEVSLENDQNENNEEQISLEEINVNDELWGEIKRVTDYGGYIDVGAVVPGFLHFMDHPEFVPGAHPSTIIKAGQRVRVWVSNVDFDLQRIKLTANRPIDLPGPRRDLF